MNKAKILVVEDDKAVRNLITTTLETQNYQYHTAEKGSEALLEAVSFQPDVMLLDLGLPDMDGIEVLRSLREWSSLPVVVVSARSHERDKVEALDLGADDYLTKPFDLDELLARVQVQLRHAAVRRASAADAPSGERLPEPAAAAAMRYKDWTLDVDARTLSVRGEPVRLTRLEFNIVEALVRRPRKVFTKRELFEIAWSEESAVEEKAVNVHVSNIRSKLRAVRSAGEIETVWGIGFKLAE